MVLILFLTTCFASVFNHSYYGEKDFDLFYGVNSPIFRSLEYNNKIVFEESEEKERYIYQLLGYKDDFLKKYLAEELIPGSLCPHQEYDTNTDYIRYSYRLLTLSYLFESLMIRENEAKKLDLNVCRNNWKEVFKKCSPKSSDMKRFIRNVPFVLEKMKTFTVSKDHSTKDYKKDFFTLDSPELNLIKDRVLKNCQNCSSDNFSNIQAELDKTCSDDQQLFQKICSETDDLWGFSGEIEPYQLLSNADLIRVINKNGHARGCLQRFSEQNKKKEKKYKHLEKLFTNILDYLTQKESPYIQGQLFPAGSLKEFSDKGLKELFELKSEPLPFIAQFKKEIVKQNIKIEKKKEVSANGPKKVETIVEKPIHKIKTIVKSTFWLAGEMRREMDLSVVDVDMDKFKFDFIIPTYIALQLEKNLKEYMTRKALEEMKRYDNLGTAKGPVPLLFIKYMIDHEQHQGLYNLIAEVGEKFYVSNDLDMEPAIETEYIQLVNNETTNFRWIINIVKP